MSYGVYLGSMFDPSACMMNRAPPFGSELRSYTQVSAEKPDFAGDGGRPAKSHGGTLRLKTGSA